MVQPFCPRIDMLKGNRCILRLRGAPVRQKLGMILENKVVQKLKLEKNVFYKRWSPILIFLNDFFFKFHNRTDITIQSYIFFKLFSRRYFRF